MFSTVIYPCLQLMAETSKTRGDKEVSIFRQVFTFLAHTCLRAEKDAHLIAEMAQDRKTVFGTPLMCSFDTRTCSFKKHATTDENRVVIEDPGERALQKLLPAKLVEHGLNAYVGAQGVKRANVLMPPIPSENIEAFLRSSLHVVGCLFWAELVRYVPDKKHDTLACDIHFGPTIVEGMCAKMRRIIEFQGNYWLRDEYMRGRMAATESWLDVLEMGWLGKSLYSTIARLCVLETLSQRKARGLGKVKLDERKAQQVVKNARSAKASKAREAIAKAPLRFDYSSDAKWAKPCLIMQCAKGHEGCSSQVQRGACRVVPGLGWLTVAG